ncbi:hypothetical protein B9Z55_028083 [Caenorhabditis nigoni]|uniref:Uncharacterized protein n=1 Tax=Caenorhabditis nigoni TaxID=1611254 RepID=A0A2G5SD43_9PELO|nr:hypothetical protein B9Z55_028083 [Caenorhabditis nigoni]
MLKPAVSISEKDQMEINTAYCIKEQKTFQLTMKLQKWERLDLSDPFTRNFIIGINADESKFQKFHDDIFRNRLDPRIKFLSVAATAHHFVGNVSQPPIAPPQIPQNHQVAAPSNFMKSKSCAMPNPQNCLIPQQNNRMVPPPKNSMPPQNFLMPQLQNSIMPPAQNWSMPPSQNSSMPTLQNSPTQPQNNQMVPPNSSWTSQNIQIPPGNVSMSAKMPQLAPSNFHASATPFLMQNQNFPMPFQQNSMSSPFNHKVFPNSEPMNSSMTSQNVSVAPPRNPTVPHQNLPIPLQTSHMEPRNISMEMQNYPPPAQNTSMMPQNKFVGPSSMAPFYFNGPPPNIQAPPGFPPISSRTFQGPPPSIQIPGGYWPTPPQIVQGPLPKIQVLSGFLPNLSRIVQGPPHNSHGPPPHLQSYPHGFPHPTSNWPTRPQNSQKQSRSIQIPPGFGPIPPQKFNGTPQNYQSAPTNNQILPPCRLISIQNIQRGVYGRSARNANMIRQNSQKGSRNNGKRSGPPINQNHGKGNGWQSIGRSVPEGEVASNSKSNVNDSTNVNTISTRGETSNDTVLKCDVTANLMDTEKAKNPNQQEIFNEEEGFLAVPVLQEPVGVPSICERHDAKTESAPIPLGLVSTRSEDTTAQNPDNLAQLPVTTEVSSPVETTVKIPESEHEPTSILTPEAEEPTLPREETVKDNVPIPITPVAQFKDDSFRNTPSSRKDFYTKSTAADKGVMGKKEHTKPEISNCKGKKNNGRNAPSFSTKPTMAPGHSGSLAKPDISLQIEKESEKVKPKKVITAIIINAAASKTESSEQNDVNSSENLKSKPEDKPSCSLQPNGNNGNKKNKKAKKTKSGKETNVEEDFDQLLKRFPLEDEKNKIFDQEKKTAPEKPKRKTIKQYRLEKVEAEVAAAKEASPIKPEFELLEGFDEFEDLDGEYCVVTDIKNIHYPTDLPLIPEEVVSKVQEQLKEFVEDVKECVREGQRLPYWPDLEFKMEDSLDLETCSQEILDFFSKKFVDLRRVDTPWAQFRRLFYSELVRDFVPQIWPVIAVFLEEGKNGSLNYLRELSLICKICNPKEHKNLFHITYFLF